MNGYELSRNWFNWAFENPEKVKPIHSAIFFFAVEHQNRLGGKEKFGFPSQMTMDAIGVKKFQTYAKALNDLCEWGFVTFIEKSKNQYSANIISISAVPKNGIARGKALDKATIKHGSKHGQSTGQSMGHGMDTIDKPLTMNHETMNHETNYSEKDFLIDWNFYRTEILKVPSHRNLIGSTDSSADFRELKIHYERKDFIKALKGLFHQQQMPNGNEVMRTSPKHILKNLDTYITACDEMNDKLYGERKKVDRL